MQGLIQQLKQRQDQQPPPSEQELANLCREYLQVLILKLIYQESCSRSLSFMGGTCLRICYDLKRYSEDLDFAWDEKYEENAFELLHQRLEYALTQRGFAIEVSLHPEKRVQKSWLKFIQVLQDLKLTTHPQQRLHIKLEIDRYPPDIKNTDRESFFVTRYNEIFPILKHTLPTLFAGKVLAILQRPYARGRDYYDLIWYLSRRTPLNLSYLNSGLQAAQDSVIETPQELLARLREQVQQMTSQLLWQDLAPFLQDPNEWDWLKNYHDVFEQLTLNGIVFDQEE